MSKVRRANKAPVIQLTRSIDSPQRLNDTIFHFVVKTPSDLGDGERDRIWRIFEENMYQLYNGSSFGWNPHQKRKELYHSSSRFILARVENHETGLDHRSIVAFVMYRFEREDDENVVYCYEVQVLNDFRRHGLGKVLMQQLADIGAAWDMHKIMLTVFKANISALRFYKALGFSIDATSSDSTDDEWTDEDALEYDCEIMSKVIVKY